MRTRARSLCRFAGLLLGTVGLFELASLDEAKAQDTATPKAPKSSTPSAVAEAERIFERAVKRLDAGDFPGACPLLEQSEQLDPSSGTLLNLGDCYEHLGRTASAWATFGEAARLASATGRADRVQVAELRRDRLVDKLRRLRPLPPSQPVVGLSLYLDDRPLPSSAWSTPVAMDPGRHAFRATAPGRADFVQVLVAPAPGVTEDLPIPELALAAPAPSDAERAARADQSGLGPQRTAAIASAGVGAVGLIVGSIFGVRSMVKHHESDAHCNGDICADRAGVELMDSARAAGNVSTVAFVVGGVGLGAAAVLWLVPVGSTATTRTAEIGFGPGTARLRATW